MLQKPAIFLDRDGVINKKMPEGGYVEEWNEFCFLPGVFEAFRILIGSGFLIIVVTNQRCIARGIITEEKLSEIHENMVREIKNEGGNINAIYFCPHDISDGCPCRKPRPGMLLKAIDDFKNKGIEIDLKNSYIIGDSEKDILAGKLVGLKTIKIGEYSEMADITKSDFRQAVKAILARDKKDLILTLKDFFEEKAKIWGIDMAFLYGSRARGYPREDSDVDVALSFLPEPFSEEESFRLITDISLEILKVGIEVNIIPLDRDFKKPMLYYNAIALGLPLYIKDFGRYITLKNQAVCQMEDFSLFGIGWQITVAKRNLEELQYA
ncbi:HAD-IIIA family hydrolase [bacterium]|nr:HAD-IIIA family hydrolase [bacterium]